jgi:CAAX prenyl protease-like protein
MDFLRKRYASSPIWARVAPYAVILVLTQFQTNTGPERYWLYTVKTVIAAWMVWEARPFVQEMRWAFSFEAVLVGIAIFGIWIGLDGYYPRLAKLGPPSNPHAEFGTNSASAWFFIIVHLVGSTVVVPPLEEIFYRSFLYRYFVKINFLAMPLGQFHALSFAVTSIFFGLMHAQFWLAGILCGLGYQWLVLRKNRLGDAMCAHAITNFLLGLWVICRNAWSFW